MNAVREWEQVFGHLPDIFVSQHGKDHVNVFYAELSDVFGQQARAIGVVRSVQECPAYGTELVHPSRPLDRLQTATDLADSHRILSEGFHRLEYAVQV